MKRLFLLTSLLCLLAYTADAQSVRVGVKGGLTFNKFSDVSGAKSVKKAWQSQTGFNAGIAVNIPVFQNFVSIQPEVLYTRLGATINDNKVAGMDYTKFIMDYVQIPVNVQVGIPIFAFRPFVFAAPYVSYAVRNKVILMDKPTENNWDHKNRFDYGFGLGAGIDIWKFQFTLKYNWGLGKISDAKSSDFQLVGGEKNRTFEISLGFLF